MVDEKPVAVAKGFHHDSLILKEYVVFTSRLMQQLFLSKCLLQISRWTTPCAFISKQVISQRHHEVE